MKKIMGIIIAMLMIIPVFSLATGQNVITNQQAPNNSRAIVDVAIHDFYFTPTPVTINVGDTVRWTNDGPSVHTSTSDTGLWNSGNLAVGATFTHTFNSAGTFNYHCAIHASMHGSVVVTGANQPPNTPSEPAGPGTRNVGQSGSYSTSATDPNGDQVQYRFDWNATGSHDISAWSALVPSGQTVSMSHAWTVAGTYVVEAQARDAPGLTSNWSTGLTVIVSSSGNTPPNTPTTPTGPTSRTVGQAGTYNTSATDPDGDQVQYRFDFDANGAHAYSAYTALVPDGQTAGISYMWNTTGTYVVEAQARDSAGHTSNWSTGLTVVVSAVNNPPNTPTVSGPSSIKKGVTAEITATTTDPDGDMIQYFFDYGDGTNSGWTAMVNPGTAAHVNHSWAKTGSFTVKVKARDMALLESGYGTLPITVPATAIYPNGGMGLLRLILERLLQWFPFLHNVLHF